MKVTLLVQYVHAVEVTGRAEGGSGGDGSGGLGGFGGGGGETKLAVAEEVSVVADTPGTPAARRAMASVPLLEATPRRVASVEAAMESAALTVKLTRTPLLI